ncbi:8010_t:CDS:2 [Entrophospora sp. SA101]|nr:8010_t:CDS:2 [Entrophospora sp. SA101]
MWSLGSGICPFVDIAHDKKLANEIIVNGKRPKMCENNFPKVFIDLMRRCWESNLKRRPTAKELFEITGVWVVDICDNRSPNETSRQFDDAEDKKFLELEKKPFSQPTIHPLAIYTSRLLDFLEFVLLDLFILATSNVNTSWLHKAKFKDHFDDLIRVSRITT